MDRQYFADLGMRLRSMGSSFKLLAETCDNIDIIDSKIANPKNKKCSIEFKLEGNKFYSEGELRKAMVSYNKALCCAEIGSEDVGIIYANRSAVALVKKLYIECLKNIQLARQHNYPMKTLLKLNEREKKCLKLISKKKTSDPKPKTFIELLYGPNIEPFTIDCLEIIYRKNEKPFVITNRDLKVGEKIAVQNPFVGVLSGNSLYMNCSNCRQLCLFDLVCDECRFAMFCSEKCKNSALEIHKYECGINSILIYDSGDLLHLDNCRSLFKALSLFNGSVEDLKQFVEESNELLTMDNWNDTNEKSFLKSYNSLSCMSTHMNTLFEFSLAINPKTRSMMVNPKSRNFLISFISKLTTIHVTGNRYQYEYHGGFYNFTVLMTFSCAPNVTGTILNDGKMLFAVQHPIKAGTKLILDNGLKNKMYYACLTKPDRKVRDFKIKCECVACVENYPTMDDQKIISQPSLRDANFRLSMAFTKLTGIEYLKMFKENNQLIHDNFDKYPCQDISLLMIANSVLLTNY